MEENKPQQSQVSELQIIQARQAAEFAMTPVGQTVKQFEVMQRMAKMYTESTIIPDAYKGNIGNCVIALDMATRMGANPLMVMQNLYVVNGNPSWSSKFLIATINMSGKYSALRYRKRNLGKVGKIKYNDLEWKTDASGRSRKTTVVKELDGTDVDNIECVAYATELSSGEVLESDPVTIETAVREGWYTKSGSKWVTMPNLMLTYRAAAFWQRMYCPEISMGFLTKEEADDIQDAEYMEVPARERLSEVAESSAMSNGNPAAPEDKGDPNQPGNADNTQKEKSPKSQSLW